MARPGPMKYKLEQMNGSLVGEYDNDTREQNKEPGTLAKLKIKQVHKQQV
jgi:hypothetical protein